MKTAVQSLKLKVKSKRKNDFHFFTIIFSFLTIFLIFTFHFSPSRMLYAGTFGKSSGETGFAFLKIPMSARAVGMGEAFTGVPNDAQGIEYNPASAGTLLTREIWFSHLSYYENINMESMHFAYPHHKGVTFFHSRFLHTKDTYRNRAGIETGDFTNQGLLVNFGHSFRITSSLSLGTSVKYISEKLADSKAQTVAADFGAFYRFPQVPVAVGMSIQNVGNDTKFESEKQPLPLAFRFGGSYRIGYRTFFSVEALQNIDQDIQLRAGIEYYLSSIFVLRSGFKLNQKKMEDYNGITAGLGFSRYPFLIDYAFVPSSDLGFVHRVSIGFKWGAVISKEKHKIEELLQKVQQVKSKKEIKEEKPYTLVSDTEFARVPELVDLHFKFDSVELDEESIAVLSKHKDYLLQNKNLEILIEGYCDDRGDEQYNVNLGLERAEMVRSIYESMEIPSNRISTVSYGSRKLLCFVLTEECRTKNRRVEIKVR